MEKEFNVAATPKKPWVAFLLSILLTGAGLAYLGKWGWAVLNLAAAIVIAIIAVNISPDLGSPVGIGVCVGSAVLAKNLADKMNKESVAQMDNTVIPTQPVITVSSENSFAGRSSIQPIFVKPATALCPKCGATTEVANFCAECGTPLTPAGS